MGQNKGVGLGTELPAGASRELSEGSRVSSYAPGDVIARVGERCDPGIVLDGLLRCSIHSDDGRRATLTYLKKGDTFGMESLFQPMAHIVIAVTPCQVIQYDRLIVEQLARKQPALALQIADELAKRMRQVDEAVASFAFMTVAERVVRHLSVLSAARGQDQGGVRLSQQQLADAVGSVREVVSRVIRELKSQHIVETSRTGIRITNEIDLYRFGVSRGQLAAHQRR